MSGTERKKKMISLRLSDAEYAILQSQYRTQGARNISDLARLALAQIIYPPGPSPVNADFRLADLEARLRHLEAEVSLILETDPVKL